MMKNFLKEMKNLRLLFLLVASVLLFEQIYNKNSELTDSINALQVDIFTLKKTIEINKKKTTETINDIINLTKKPEPTPEPEPNLTVPILKTSKIITYLNPRIDKSVANEIATAIDKYSLQYKLPRNLIIGIIFKESTFNPMAKSKVAYGLMQVYPKFHQEKLDKRNITDLRLVYHIDTNIDIGCEIFREYYDRAKGDLEGAFHMYLSKNATEAHRDYYMKVVFTTWVKIDFYEYQHEGEDEKK